MAFLLQHNRHDALNTPGAPPVALAAGLAAIGDCATLTPTAGSGRSGARTPPWCLVCGELGAVDVLLNVALFVPLGAALRFRGTRSGRIAALRSS